jgi:hypothetical protein
VRPSRLAISAQEVAVPAEIIDGLLGGALHLGGEGEEIGQALDVASRHTATMRADDAASECGELGVLHVVPTAPAAAVGAG